MTEKLKRADSFLYKLVLILIVIELVAGVILWIDSGAFFMFLVAVIAALALWCDYIIAGYFYFIAVDKGYSDVAFLRMSFFLTLVGYIMVAAMPNNPNTQSINELELPEI
ncbi:MAG: hypothetical protein Q4G23_12355 [Clostridia bacterium]|nr:hypothetical protein [Clostridia bacterium]